MLRRHPDLHPVRCVACVAVRCPVYTLRGSNRAQRPGVTDAYATVRGEYADLLPPN
jgi:hypothetical protein